MGVNATIDDARCISQSFSPHPQKNGKDRLKVQCIGDSKTFYFNDFNDSYIYSGKGSDSKDLTDEEHELQEPT